MLAVAAALAEAAVDAADRAPAGLWTGSPPPPRPDAGTGSGPPVPPGGAGSALALATTAVAAGAVLAVVAVRQHTSIIDFDDEPPGGRRRRTPENHRGVRGGDPVRSGARPRSSSPPTAPATS